MKEGDFTYLQQLFVKAKHWMVAVGKEGIVEVVEVVGVVGEEEIEEEVVVVLIDGLTKGVVKEPTEGLIEEK